MKKMKNILIIFILLFCIVPVVYAEKCDALLTHDAAEFIKEIITYIRIGVPILLIILSVVDFVSVIGSQDDNAMKKAISNVTKRFIAAALIFFVPLIIGLILGIDAVKNALNLVDDPTCEVAN